MSNNAVGLNIHDNGSNEDKDEENNGLAVVRRQVNVEKSDIGTRKTKRNRVRRSQSPPKEDAVR